MGKRVKIVLLVLTLVILTACSNAPENPSDMSGYNDMRDVKVMFYDTNVKEIIERMDSGETFAVYFGFKDCPWCNLMVPELNEVARREKAPVGYVNTRLNPEWETNADIDDYDLFVERFGKYLKKEENGKRHLYVPDVYFIKDGEVVFHTRGIVGDGDTLTEEDVKTMRREFRSGFESMR